MSESTREMLRASLESTRETLTEVWARLDEDTEDEGYDADADVTLDELPLEIVWALGEPFAVVLGTGGPHVEIRGGGRHDGSGYALHGYWGGEHVTLTGESVTRTGTYFREMVEES